MTDLFSFKVSSLLKEIDLADQKDALSKDLSGGQKRKLCVGMALIGDPKVVIFCYTVVCILDLRSSVYRAGLP